MAKEVDIIRKFCKLKNHITITITKVVRRVDRQNKNGEKPTIIHSILLIARRTRQH